MVNVTGVGRPWEWAQMVPPSDQWSESTCSILPIGQGVSMTLLQMTGMYQASANDGRRIPPRIVKATIAADGATTAEPQPGGIRVVSPETARTVRNMLRAVVQRDPMGTQQGTGWPLYTSDDSDGLTRVLSRRTCTSQYRTIPIS